MDKQTFSWRRFISLTQKEFRQLLRDKSNLLIGILLPIVLIFIFGYGMNLDAQNVPLAVVNHSSAPQAKEIVAALNGTPYLRLQQEHSETAAQALLRQHKVGGVLIINSNFAADLAQGKGQIQLLANGTDQTRALALNAYVNGVISQYWQKQVPHSGKKIEIINRTWFNAANSSTWYLVPGLIVLITTLVGVFLTALVMAREWERGTLEALFVTPVRPVEILCAKIVPYFCVGMLGLAMCLAAARWLFNIPLQGSLGVLLVLAMLYMLVSVALGLLISAATKNQFLASQLSLVTSFLPSMMLSNFIFDLHNVPQVINIIGHLLPATYFMESIKTLFLAGNHWQLIGRNGVILAAYVVVLLALAVKVTRKKLL